MHTGDESNAGTDASIYIMLHGERGDTGKRKLIKSDNSNKFEQGQVYQKTNIKFEQVSEWVSESDSQ